jgi:hypothetical protein
MSRRVIGLATFLNDACDDLLIGKLRRILSSNGAENEPHKYK